MNKHQIRGRVKQTESKMKEVVERGFAGELLQGRGLIEKKMRIVQGDYRDATHDFKRRH